MPLIGNNMKVRFVICFLFFLFTMSALHTELAHGCTKICVSVEAYPPILGIIAPFKVRAFINIRGPWCGTPLEVRGIEAVLTIPNEMIIVNGANPQKLGNLVVPIGIEKVIKAEWVVRCYRIGVHDIIVDVTSENAPSCSVLGKVTISEIDPAISEPSLDPHSPIVGTDTVVSTTVGSSFGVKNATLHYTAFGQLEEQIIKMRQDPAQNDRWVAVIPKQPETVVLFYITVFDNRDNFINSPEAMFYSYEVKDVARIESRVRFAAWITAAVCAVGLITVLFGYWKIVKPRFVGDQKGLLVLGTAELHQEFYGIDRVEAVSAKRRRRHALLLRLIILALLFLLWSVVLSQMGWIW